MLNLGLGKKTSKKVKGGLLARWKGKEKRGDKKE
jgi:hypothetical protein